nr:hypothetical protein [Tanacetum cinerariifolium]
MAELHFNNNHNKVTYLLKPTESLEVSLPDGGRGLVATIDGTAYTVTKASIRSALQLDDLNVIDTMTNEEIFVGLWDIGGTCFCTNPTTRCFSTPSSPVVASHPFPDPMPSPPRQSSPPPIPFVLETITSPFRDDDTGGGSFHENPPRPHPATLTFSPTRIATLEAKLKATKILHRDTVVLFAKRIKKLERKLKTKKRKLEISPTTLDVVLTLSQSKARARAATIIYTRLKKQKSSFGLDFTDADIPAGGLDSAGGLTSAGILVAAGPTVPAEPSSPLRDPSKGKAVATPSSPVTAPTAKELADQQAAIFEVDRQELLKQELKQCIDAEQVYLDSLVALNLTNEEWIGLVDQVRDNPTLSVELLGADVSEDTFSVIMVKLMNRQRKSSAIYTTGWTWKFVRGLTDDQLRIEYDKIHKAVNLATTKDQHRHLKRSGETLESLESKTLKSSYSTTQPTKLQETTFVSASATIAAGDPIPAVTSISVGFFFFASSSIPAATPIAAGVSTTAGASRYASEASVLIIELLDSPPKDTSLPLDPETKEQDAPLRKSSRKKSISRKRTLPSPSKPKSDALPFDEDNLEAAFKRYLRQASDVDEPAEPVSLALVSDITTWEIILIEFRRGEIHVITRADGTVKRFSTLRELMYWAGRADLMVLYGLVSDKYKTERATGSVAYPELEILCPSWYSCAGN